MRAISTYFRNLVVLRRGRSGCKNWNGPMEEWSRSLSSLLAQSESGAEEIKAHNTLIGGVSVGEVGQCSGRTSQGSAGDSHVGDWGKLLDERKLDEAVEMLDGLVQQGCYLHNSVFYGVLKRCIEERDLVLGSQTHALAVRSGYGSDKFLSNHIICMYASHGKLEEALQVFTKVTEPDRYMWSSIILAHARKGQPAKALILYRQLRESRVMPDNHLFVAALKACATAGDLTCGKEIHADILKSANKANIFVGNSLVDMYAKCRSLENARRVFDSLPRKNVVTWNAMIVGYVQQGFGQEVLNLYRDMQHEGVTPPDAVTFASLLQACGIVAGLEKGREIHAQISKIGLEATDLFIASTLIDMYSKCGSMVEAQKVFDALPTRDIVTWNALIAGYNRLIESELVFHYFNRMKEEHVSPNDVTFLSILTVCSHMGLVDKGQKYFEVMVKEHGITPTIKHYNCMIDLLGRAGQLDKAMEMVTTMPFQPHGETWRSMLSACRKWNNALLGRVAFESAVKLNQQDAAAYDLMSNIYEAARMSEEAKDIQAMKIQAQAWKEPGQCWLTDRGGMMQTFIAGES